MHEEDDPICIGIRIYQPRKLSELHSVLILVQKAQFSGNRPKIFDIFFLELASSPPSSPSRPLRMYVRNLG